MINIEEKIASKVSGETSLYLSFDYKPEYVDIVKQLSGSSYDKKNKIWEIPKCYLSNLLDNLCIYDEINLKLLKDKKNKVIEEPKLNLSNYKVKPYKYQEDGIKYGLTHNKWMLLDEQGLGKTYQLIYLASELKRKGEIDHCLIVCGLSSLKENWRKEIQKFTNLSCTILGQKTNRKGKKVDGSIQDRLEQLKKPIKEFFVITNIETFRNEDIVKILNKGPNDFGMTLLDESHRIKDPNAIQAKGFLKANKSKYAVSATGTMIMNSPLDAYVPLKWLGIEKGTFTNFKYLYCNLGGPFQSMVLGYKNLDMLKEIIDKNSLRRTKDILDLPPKTIINEYLDMEPAQDKFYENIKLGIKDQVDKVKLNTSSVFSMVARLRQATACPSILTTENIPSAKIDRACELVDTIIGQGDKVVIFSTFKKTLEELEKRLKQYSPLVNTGDTPNEEVSKNVDLFQKDNMNYPLFLGTFAKCSTGLTLNKARYMICLDECWTAAQNAQAFDRIHRIGTIKPVFIYKLITNNTIDEHVDEVVNDKGAISDYLIDGVMTQETLNRLRKYLEEI